MNKEVLNYIDANKKNMIGFLSKLISIPTINPPGQNYEEFVELLEKKCKGIGLKSKRYKTPKPILKKYHIQTGSERISLVADFISGATKTLHINCHYDVVPVTDKWTFKPFKATIRGNRIYGRGTEDMKGNIASVLLAIEAIKKCRINPKINIELSFTPDEEIGGRTGLGYLVEKGLVRADYAMSEGFSDDYVSIGNKGVLWIEVSIKGKASHASRPERGINAFERMNELVNLLNKLKHRLAKRKTSYDIKGGGAKCPTFVMGGYIEGGVKVNVVPGEIKFSIDRRLIPEENVEIAKKEVEDVVRKFNKQFKDSKATLKFLIKDNPSISVRNEALFKTVSSAIKAISGKDTKFCIMPGATDMRYFMRKGIPALGYGAKGGESWHSDDEYVNIDSLINTAKVYALIMKTLE